jgi:hypothetical protein
MYIEAVTVCVNYSDFLAYTLPLNKQHFDHWVIITTKEDKETQRLCSHHNVECLITDRFTENGDPFNKAKGINEGLLYHSKRDWMIHIDADIVLPPLFRKIVQSKNLHHNYIYGADRLMCPTFEEWTKHVQKPKPLYDNWIYIHLDAFPIAARVADYNGDGYAPIGYFQMWHPQDSKQLLYPEEHGAADRTDMAFAKRWKRENRILLPEIITIHLDSENATVESVGKNWQGRKTIPFGYVGTPPQNVPIKRKKWLLWTSISIFGAAAITFLIIYHKQIMLWITP